MLSLSSFKNMTIFLGIIFALSTASLFGMLWYRAWEIKKAEKPLEIKRILPPEIYFRQIEKIMLYLTKHIVQWIVIGVAKYWFIFSTKSQKWFVTKLPRVHDFFTKKKPTSDKPTKTFVGRAILESKIKIKRVKERVKKEHSS